MYWMHKWIPYKFLPLQYFWKVWAVISTFCFTNRNTKAQTHAQHFCADWARTTWIFQSEYVQTIIPAMSPQILWLVVPSTEYYNSWCVLFMYLLCQHVHISIPASQWVHQSNTKGWVSSEPPKENLRQSEGDTVVFVEHQFKCPSGTKYYINQPRKYSLYAWQ